MKIILSAALAASVLAFSQAAAADPIPIVAAENFYGDLATQIGGDLVAVTSILSNPDEDPHLFEASPATARALAGAKVVIYNGADYDPWMGQLIAANKAPERKVIIAAVLVNRKPGDNPHLWYDPATMPAVAEALTAALAKADLAHAADYQKRKAAFLDSLAPMNAKIDDLRGRFYGTYVTATEPVFGYMSDAIGFKMRNYDFQVAVMNDTDPTPNQVIGVRNDIWHHKIKVFFYNSQATDDLAKSLRDEAVKYDVPVVGVTETEPPGMTYQQWMMSQLDALDKALSTGAK